MRRFALLCALTGCSSGASPAAETNWPAPGSLVWVDPARCLSPCSDDAAARVVPIDPSGRLDPNGAFRVLDVAQPALSAMLAGASAAGYVATVSSAFRTFDEQLMLYEQATEIGRTARPGHSEHELGTAVDLDDHGSGAFAWLAERCAAFGFLLSFPEHLQKTTGLRYEPWHFRYVGSDLARAVRSETTSLEAYLHAHPGAAREGDCSDCASDLSRSACGSVTPDGECAGTVLRWCFDGALAQVDCATTGSTCGADAGSADCR
jgi:D-alanyl-D-alanine carboxypeptidase